MAATTENFCVICLIDNKLTPSIEWPGAPYCRECLAKAIEGNSSSRAPICRDIAKREPHPAPSPSLGVSSSMLQ
jgi:hypothetical protein